MLEALLSPRPKLTEESGIWDKEGQIWQSCHQWNLEKFKARAALIVSALNIYCLSPLHVSIYILFYLLLSLKPVELKVASLRLNVSVRV